MDFVNQSVLQISSHDVEGKRSDKTDFAEKLGAMNRRWQILQGLIGEKVMFQAVWSRIRPETFSAYILVCCSELCFFILDSAFGRTLGRLVGA